MTVPAIVATANPQQRAAITTIAGPLLIIAGPGSGKTFTLVEQVVHLITTHTVAPEQFLQLTTWAAWCDRVGENYRLFAPRRVITSKASVAIHRPV